VEVDLETLCGAEVVFVVMLLGDFGGWVVEIMLWDEGSWGSLLSQRLFLWSRPCA
jgi:hypothetical protein